MKIAKSKKFLLAIILCGCLSGCAWAGERIENPEGTTIEITDETFSELPGDGQTVSNGGAVENEGTITEISGSSFTENEATYGGAISNSGTIVSITNSSSFTGNITSSGGGAIYNNKGEIGIIKDSTFSSNTAGSRGGAIYNNSGEIGSISGSNFDGNEAPDGGAMYNSGGTINEITDSTFTGNIANDSSGLGGAIYNSGGTIESIKNSYFQSNTAGTNGGAIYNSSGSSNSIGSIEGSYFLGNSATSSGGAIYNSTGNIKSIAGSHFEENNATSGGAIYNNSGSSSKIESISESYFQDNRVTSNGGAIYNNNGTIQDIKNSYFQENTAATNGGAIYNSSGNSKIESIAESYFRGNSATSGGAIYNNSGSINSIAESNFEGNNATNGGAIYNSTGSIGDISGGSFVGNSSGDDGGAIYNDSGSIGAFSGVTFDSNSASGDGGAIYNSGSIGADSGISDSVFEGNSATNGSGGAIYNVGTVGEISDGSFVENSSGDNGGAIYNSGTIGADSGISDSVFEGNSATDGSGGAIYNIGTIGEISDGTFEGNSAGDNGGAIYNDSGSIGTISGVIFDSNIAEGDGGAIYNGGSIGADSGISDSAFEGNSATNGGAIFNVGTMSTLTNASFYDNSATGNGGAIYTTGDLNVVADGVDVVFSGNSAANGGAIYTTGTMSTLTNASFYDNSATGNGGAIYTTGDLNVVADGGSVVFSGNSAGEGDAIYMDNAEGTIAFSLSNGGSVILEDSISGEDGYSVVVSGDGSDATFYLLTDAYNADFSAGNVTVNTINNEIHTYAFKSFSLTGDVEFVADVDLANEMMDGITAESYGELDGTINISGMNLISDTDKDAIKISFADDELKEHVTSSVGVLPDSANQQKAYTPIREYNISFDNGGDGISFVFDNAGFNPAVMAPEVEQAAVYRAMNMIFEYNFEHSDYFMKLPAEVRLAKREAAKAKKSAAKMKESDARKPAFYNQNEMTARGAWFRTFASNESVSYRGGWESRDKYYGGLVGFDSSLREHGDGWASVFTGYAGFLGIRQSYSGGHIKQRGGIVGVTESFYRKNFYTAWTAAVGVMKADEHTMYGHEKSRNNTWGVAGKLGWNFEFGGGKFALLPTFTVSYSTVNPEDYTTAADVDISGSGVRAVQLNPNVKFIVNLRDGWQPYLTVGEIWTVGQSSSVDATWAGKRHKLDELELRPYTEYGLGVQKRWANERDAYVQVLGHSDGRDGILVNAGLRWNF